LGAYFFDEGGEPENVICPAGGRGEFGDDARIVAARDHVAGGAGGAVDVVVLRGEAGLAGAIFAWGIVEGIYEALFGALRKVYVGAEAFGDEEAGGVVGGGGEGGGVVF
jgi:hypothetical protein